MIKYFYYDKIDNELSMICDGNIVVDKDKFDVIKKDVTEEIIDDIRSSKKTYIRNKDFEIIPYDISDTEKQKEKAKKITELKEKVKNTKNIDELKGQITELIDNLL